MALIELKRETGASPVQSRCCKFRKGRRHHATRETGEGVGSRPEQVRRPAIGIFVDTACEDERRDRGGHPPCSAPTYFVVSKACQGI